MINDNLEHVLNNRPKYLSAVAKFAPQQGSILAVREVQTDACGQLSCIIGLLKLSEPFYGIDGQRI